MGSVLNLLRSARDTPAELPWQAASAADALVAGFIAPVSMVGPLFGWPVPMLLVSLLLAIPVGMMGYGVATLQRRRRRAYHPATTSRTTWYCWR